MTPLQPRGVTVTSELVYQLQEETETVNETEYYVKLVETSLLIPAGWKEKSHNQWQKPDGIVIQTGLPVFSETFIRRVMKEWIDSLPEQDGVLASAHLLRALLVARGHRVEDKLGRLAFTIESVARDILFAGPTEMLPAFAHTVAMHKSGRLSEVAGFSQPTTERSTKSQLVVEAAVRPGTTGIHLRVWELPLPEADLEGIGSKSESAYSILIAEHERENQGKARNAPPKFPTFAWNWWVIPEGTTEFTVYYWASEAIIGFCRDGEPPNDKNWVTADGVDLASVPVNQPSEEVLTKMFRK